MAKRGKTREGMLEKETKNRNKRNYKRRMNGLLGKDGEEHEEGKVASGETRRWQ
jgi:hypothetical protein